MVEQSAYYANKNSIKVSSKWVQVRSNPDPSEKCKQAVGPSKWDSAHKPKSISSRV